MKRWIRRTFFLVTSHPICFSFFQCNFNLSRWVTTVSCVEPFDQIIRPCILCLHVPNPAKYSSSGIDVFNLSSLKHSLGSWLRSMSHTLFKASTNDFCVFCCGFCVIFDLDRGWLLSSRHIHGMLTIVPATREWFLNR